MSKKGSKKKKQRKLWEMKITQSELSYARKLRGTTKIAYKTPRADALWSRNGGLL